MKTKKEVLTSNTSVSKRMFPTSIKLEMMHHTCYDVELGGGGRSQNEQLTPIVPFGSSGCSSYS